MVQKIIHCDADCFYAAVEMRDDPRLRDRPMAVGGRSARGVITTCNYEARRFGVHSAMPTAYARRLCPDLVIVPGRMEQYREVSRAMRTIFADYSTIIEPLSLDEAYLDVSDSEQHGGSATWIARALRQRIQRELGITVSAGVAPCKFLAKIASDWNKPDGLVVIAPDQVDEFVRKLPVAKVRGVGKVTAQKLHNKGLYLCADLRRYGLTALIRDFGAFGKRLFELAQGVDHSPVKSHWIRKSLSVERTYSEDFQGLPACEAKLPGLLSELRYRLQRLDSQYRIAKAFVKIKFNDFTVTTLERIGSTAEYDSYLGLLREAIDRRHNSVRLLGIGVRFQPAVGAGEFEQLELFDSAGPKVHP